MVYCIKCGKEIEESDNDKQKTTYEYLCKSCKKIWVHSPEEKKEKIINIIAGVFILVPLAIVVTIIVFKTVFGIDLLSFFGI